MASNGDWGILAEHDPDMGDAWDGFDPLPESGTNPTLDAFVARKNLSIASLVRVGARLSADDTLAFVYPGGLKYRNMETGDRWNYIGSDFTAMKIVPYGLEPSDTVIVAEGETDGAWLSEHFPVDVALLPVGAKGIKPAYIEQLLRWDRVLVGLDNDAAGEAGWQKIRAGVPYAARLRPPAGDWCESTEVPELPVVELQKLDRVGALIFEDLAAAYRKELPPPTIIVDDLMYNQGVHWVSGHPDSGKSIMAMYMSWCVMCPELNVDVHGDVSRHVVWLDYEQGKRMTGQRLSEMGIPWEILGEKFHYAWWPTAAVDELGAVAERWPGCLVVVDSMSKALSAAGIDEDKNTEVLAWTIKLIQASKQHDLPIIVVDHVAKSDKDSDYARGAGTKQADTDVHWKASAVEDFNREQRGTIMLTRHKDREAWLPPRKYFDLGGGGNNGDLNVSPSDGPDADDAGLPPV